MSPDFAGGMLRAMRIAPVSLCACALWLAAARPAPAQSAAITRAFAGADGLAHVEQNGKETIFPKETGQVSIDSVKVAPDGRAAGWLVNEPNCCTSYPVPICLVVVRGNSKHVFAERQMIYDWHFVEGSARVALSIGPTHGEFPADFLLYDTGSGQKLQEWGPSTGTSPPKWASGLRQ